MSKNFKFILYLPTILFFFQAFYFPLLGKFYMVFYLFLYFSLVICMLKDFNGFVSKIIKTIRTTPLLWFAIMVTYISLNSFFVSIIGVSSFSQTIGSIITQLLLGIIPITIYYIFIIDKYITYKDFMQFFMFLFWVNLIIGFICYLGQVFNVAIINTIFDKIANVRFMQYTSANRSLEEASAYIAFGLPRLDNLFDEPSSYAKFLYIFLPFTYAFSLNEFKIFSTHLLNNIIKRTLIPFTWLSIILTFSPIYLILCLIITALYFYKNIKIFIGKHLSLFAIMLFLFFLILMEIDVSNTYLSRIINVLTNIHSFDDFILVEPSLATRFCSFINSFCIFLHHPLTGVGLGNIVNQMYMQYINSPVPLTPEIITLSKLYLYTIGKVHMNYGFVYVFLAENGIISFLILSIFFYKLLSKLNLLIKLEKVKSLQLDYTLLYSKALKYSLIAIFIITFYNLNFTATPIYIIIALAISLLYRENRYCKIKTDLNIEEHDENR